MIKKYNELICRLRKLEGCKNAYRGERRQYIEDEILYLKGRTKALEKLIFAKNEFSDFDIMLMILNGEK